MTQYYLSNLRELIKPIDHIPLLSILNPKSVGGNAHENWTLIRFLPLMIGHRVQHEEPAWQILTDLKDIVELVVCPVHTENSFAYLDFNISEHRTRFQEVFPFCDLKPKPFLGTLPTLDSPMWSFSSFMVHAL